jgi:hypothetical protein
MLESYFLPYPVTRMPICALRETRGGEEMQIGAYQRRYGSESERDIHPHLQDSIVEHEIDILHYWCRYYEQRLMHCDKDCEHRTYCPLYNPHVARMPL